MSLLSSGITLASLQVQAQEIDFSDLPEAPSQTVVSEDEIKAMVAEKPAVSVDNSAAVPAPTAPLAEPARVAPTDEEIAAYLENLPPEQRQAFQVQQEPKAIPYSGTYYDADSIGAGALGEDAGPRRVDPKYEPGSSFVVVQGSLASDSREAQIIGAQRALKLGRNSSALALYEKLYKQNRRDRQVLMGLAVAQQKSGFTESAIATYQELLKLAPKHTGAMVNLTGLLEGRQPEYAYGRLKKLWDKNPQNSAVVAQLGLVAAKMEDYDAATRYLGIAASLEPRNPLHYYNLAIVMDKGNIKKEAIEYYQKSLEIDIANRGSASAIPREKIYDRLAALRRL